MSLTVTAPTGPITRFAGGTVMIRCADYVFPSTRGTVGVVTDAQSVCGDVVHETQLVPYATSAGFGAPWLADYEYVDTEAADPTLSIPIDDLPLEPGMTYVAFLGVKIVGAGDINHRVGEQFIDLGDQNTRVRGYNDVIDDSVYPSIQPPLPRPETNPQYRLKWFQHVTWNYQSPITIPYHGFDSTTSLDPPPTDLIVVAASGEDSTYESYLDAIYLVPWHTINDPGDNYIQAPADLTAWDPLDDEQTFDPQPTRDHDDNAATNALNIIGDDAGYSVMFAEPAGYGTGYLAPGGDYQRAQSEATAYNINNFDLWSGPEPDWPNDPSSWIPITTALIVVPAQTIETETFGTDHAAATNPWSFLSTSGEYYWTTYGGDSFTTSVTGGELDFDAIECLAVNARKIAKFGYQGFPLPLTGTPSHSEIRELVRDLSSGTISASTAIHSIPDNGTMYSWTGWEASHSLSDIDMDITGVALYLDGGDLKATLRAHSVYDPQFGSTMYSQANFGTSPVTIQGGYSFGDVVNVIVERRYYVWRAKVWMDGDAEPGGWTLEGLQVNFFPDLVNFPTTYTPSQYPYSNADRDVWGRNVRAYMDQYPCLGAVTDVQTGSATAFGHVTFDNFVLSYDPVGSRDTGHISLEKHDGSVQYGTAEFDTDRLIIASLAQHTFDGDTNGYNVYLWADSGAAELQSITATDFIMRAPIPGPIYGDIKHP